MTKVTALRVPDGTALAGYAGGADYTDCFAVTVAGDHSLADFVTSFYQTRLFRAEAAVLRILARRPSSHDQAAALAQGRRDDFAAWTVETRNAKELLMCDMSDHTRSWFSTAAGQGTTTLLFGSVVTADQSGNLGWIFRLLLPFHKVYARALLRAAARRLSAD